MSKEYKRSLEDEIDWKRIDQLHTATVNFSSTSLELKKLYFILIGIAVPSIIKLSGDKLDASLFATLYILTLTFWFLDSFTYFYQEKLREKMNDIFSQLKERNKDILVIPNGIKQNYVLEENRTHVTRLWRSISNHSVRLYFVLLLLNSIAVFLFSKGFIK